MHPLRRVSPISDDPSSIYGERWVPIEGPLSGLALSSDGKILATRQLTKHKILLLDVATGKTVGEKIYGDYSEDVKWRIDINELQDARLLDFLPQRPVLEGGEDEFVISPDQLVAPAPCLTACFRI